jgi:hypothetical protein
MKRTLRILTVLSIAASSILFATPSQAAPSTQWAYVVTPNSIFVKSITGLSVGMTAKGYPVIAANIVSGNTSTTITAIGSLSTVTTTYGLGSAQGGCDYYGFNSTTRKACVNFASGDQGYVVTLSAISFAQPQELEVGFDGGLIGPSTTSPTSPTSVVATTTGKRSATVSFAAPASNGGSAVTSYTATSTPGGISKTLTQATGGTFTFDGLQPGTAYTFAVTATNAIGTSAAATSNSITTTPLVVASLSSLSFVDDGTGTGGKIVWAGQNIDAVLYTGPANSYPGPYNYGAFTGGWNGRIRNLTADTSYTVSIFAVSSDGVGESKSLTFKTSATLPTVAGAKSATVSLADQMATQMPKLFAWIDENVFVDGEAATLKMMLNKFDEAKVRPYSAFLKLPVSSVAKVSAISITPAVCKVEGQVTVHSIAAGTCTISYTVSGGSKAPATMVKDFVFKKFTN